LTLISGIPLPGSVAGRATVPAAVYKLVSVSPFSLTGEFWPSHNAGKQTALPGPAPVSTADTLLSLRYWTSTFRTITATFDDRHHLRMRTHMGVAPGMWTTTPCAVPQCIPQPSQGVSEMRHAPRSVGKSNNPDYLYVTDFVTFGESSTDGISETA